jgi:hypothetical protein
MGKKVDPEEVMGESKSITIKLFHLKRQDTMYQDEYTQCIVAAATEKEARELANRDSEAEGYVWTDGMQVEAKELSDSAHDGVAGIQIWSREPSESNVV